MAAFKEEGCDVGFAFRASAEDGQCRTVGHCVGIVAPERSASRFLDLGCSVFSLLPPDETFDESESFLVCKFYVNRGL